MKQKDSKDDNAAQPFNGPAGLIVAAILILASIYCETLAIAYFTPCRAEVSHHAGPTFHDHAGPEFHSMPVQDFTPRRSRLR
jgi:hypothetical protein